MAYVYQTATTAPASPPLATNCPLLSPPRRLSALQSGVSLGATWPLTCSTPACPPQMPHRGLWFL